MKDLVVLGGPNGAGKTTAPQVVVPRKLGLIEFVNADEIALGLSPYDPEGQLSPPAGYLRGGNRPSG
jgi:predicted ABC-type ATPase